MSDAQSEGNGVSARDKLLFWACFISLVATSFGFIIRALLIGTWGEEFGLSATQQGEIFGVGLWPFAISIVLFSLIIDKVGYGKAMVFAFACHVIAAIMTINASGYMDLYIATFILALGNGTVEAVINPVVATMFPKSKTKWLAILHAGWPAGLVLGGILVIFMGDAQWQWKVGLVLIPVLIYGVMMLRCYFPPNERVAAGVSYKDMLKEVGFLGALLVSGLIAVEVGRVFGWHWGVQVAVALAATIAYGFYVDWAPGRPLFLFLILIMIPLATTELGTDGWISELMTPAMTALNVHPGWVLVYTSAIMMLLRFYASGPIVHALSPLGVLVASSIIAIFGLVFLSMAEAAMVIFIAATIYGVGKSFFWPAMLGLVAEQSPKGGALTLNTIAGVGMLGVGIIGAAFLGNIQDREQESVLRAEYPALHAVVVEPEPVLSVFGSYNPLRGDQIERMNMQVALYESQQEAREALQAETGTAPSAEELSAYLAADAGYEVQVLTALERFGVQDAGDTLAAQIAALEQAGAFVDTATYNELSAQTAALAEIDVASKKNALFTVAIFPFIMLICYIILILYFRSKGGYKAVVLDAQEGEAAH